ncbi:MAG TPA: hypothetical protein VHX13_08440 [Acidobacteriaceae bacterium]|jgi:hypothetical protein|nr:hypothetical protein [Acidobacteriaceae bacterium]
MRRAWAAFLVVLFSYPLIAPAFASGPDNSQLPACCRRNGRHHCAMQMADMALGNVPSQFATVSEKCPYSPFAHCPLMLPHSFRPSALRTAAGLSQGPALIVRAAEAGYRISADRARHKRGPPRLLSL